MIFSLVIVSLLIIRLFANRLALIFQSLTSCCPLGGNGEFLCFLVTQFHILDIDICKGSSHFRTYYIVYVTSV